MISGSSTTDTQQLWQEFGAPLRAFITRRVGSAADVEDILQDVFLRIHQHAAGVQRSERLTSWLYQVTRNAIVDYYRAPARREQPESVTGAATLDWTKAMAPAAEIALDPVHVREELASCLRPMIERLPPHYREAVALVDLTGLTQVEAASRLGLSVSGMKSRVQRGRQSLKRVLVECCPVQLDTGGRIVDYNQAGPACTSCSGSREVATPVEDQSSHHGRCCAPPSATVGDPWALEFAV
jgi:RNA polymerase sigma-70 factor (ECF subfamily)